RGARARNMGAPAAHQPSLVGVPEPPCDGNGNPVVACGGVGQPEAVLTGMVGGKLGGGRGTVGSTEVGLGRGGAELRVPGGGLLNAGDGCAGGGGRELGDASGLGDGERDCDADAAAEADGAGEAAGPELARVASAGFAVS